MKVGYTSGVFDLFHQGHENYLLACSSLCDFLIVGVDSDCRTKMLKGDFRPIDNVSIRLNNVKSYCGHAFEKNEPSHVYINKYRPDFLFRSIDNISRECCGKDRVIYIPYTEGISTTLLISELNLM